ncbi:ABC transporter ATP-binding protein [Coriobacteriia bacterium Es71-Z0120]|uniref:ABC transporter ATP-binding protein n=1 Tax=Parvivirga hydrogeniphila TaxID=2939460 RepID=UPI002260BE1A|nr:ABC transporter ATP-binding protein [Parvivirga hydrogeniphila]MCL4078456.1 ABC transporter ATP-binding protein [Parvivirga hydrogeniphila]
MSAILEATGVRKSYRRQEVLDVEHVALAPGTTLALLGPSGAGKSTLLAILGLLERPDGGRIVLDGREVTVADRSARMRIAAAFQRPWLFKGTVGANVAYGLALRGVPASERRARVVEALARVGLAGWENRSALTLSGGEAQRVALARALAVRPRVLLLDEPLASLDPLVKWRLAREFAEVLREDGMAVLWVTHDQDEAALVADEVAVMRDGRIVASGPADEVFLVPGDAWAAGFLGLETPARGVVAEVEEGVARVACDGADIFAVADVRPGERVRVGVRPEDVVLFEAGAAVPPSSARNRLRCTVHALEHTGTTYRAVLGCGGVRLAARVSKAAARELGLAPGAQVLAVFKATAVRVASERDKSEGASG